MKTTEYKELKKQLEEQYKQAILLAEKQRIDGITAIETVWKMLHVPRRKRQATIESQQQAEHPMDSNSLHVETPPVVTKSNYGTLVDTVKKSLTLVPETFTSKQVVAAMQQISGIKFNNSSVSNRLKRLAQDGKIERIKQGHGKSPSEYKRKITMNEPITNVS
jgi:hypothetical protein